MSVILNPAGIEAYMQSPTVVAFVERSAARVVGNAQKNVRTYFASAPALDVDQDIGLDMEGSKAIVGIKDKGNKARLLAQKQAEGRINWLTDALKESHGA